MQPVHDTLFENLITVEELANGLGKAPKTIRNWVAKRQIPFVRVGNRTGFIKASIEEWLKSKEKPCQLPSAFVREKMGKRRPYTKRKYT